jgi:hypothetical protein
VTEAPSRSSANFSGSLAKEVEGMPTRLAVRDAAATCQRDLARIANDLKGLGEYPSTKDVVKHLQALVEALQRFMREAGD